MASAAILVGGQARRFGGRDKGTLLVGGRSILERQLAELTQVAHDIMLVGGAELLVGGAEERTVGDTRGPARLRRIADRVPHSGPLGGLDAALAAADDEPVLLLACDMPFVTAPFLGHLLSLAPLADAVVPRTKRGYHPLCAVYARACHGPVLRRLAEGRLRMLGLLEEVRVRAVEQDDIDGYGRADRLLANVNTAAEFAELETFPGHKP